MRVSLSKYFVVSVFVMLFVAYDQEVRGQITASEKVPIAIKVLDVGNVSRATFKREMKKFWRSYDSTVELYIMNYGRDKDIAQREKVITSGLTFRHFDRSRITLVRGGFGTGPRTVIWKLPKGAVYPNLRSLRQ